MSKSKRKIAVKKPEALFGRVVSILEQARGNVVRAVNSNMVLAYWLIGREIVHGMQGGEERATQTLNNVVLIFMFNPVRMQLSPRHVFISVP
jgi:hypothetical protein